MTKIYEQLVGLRGRCKFHMHMPKRTAIYGIYSLTDARVCSTSLLEIYAGKQLQGASYTVSNSTYSVVMHLVPIIANSQRNVTQ
jgi:hypothetical protein